MISTLRAVVGVSATTLLGFILGAALGFAVSVAVVGLGFSLQPPRNDDGGRAAVGQLLGMSQRQANQIFGNVVGLLGGGLLGAAGGAAFAFYRITKLRREEGVIAKR